MYKPHAPWHEGVCYKRQGLCNRPCLTTTTHLFPASPLRCASRCALKLVELPSYWSCCCSPAAAAAAGSSPGCLLAGSRCSRRPWKGVMSSALHGTGTKTVCEGVL